MTTQEAIIIMESHNAWRRDDNDVNSHAQQEPKLIGEAIDRLIAVARAQLAISNSCVERG